MAFRRRIESHLTIGVGFYRNSALFRGYPPWSLYWVNDNLLMDYIRNIWGKSTFQLWNRFGSKHLRRVFTARGYSVLELVP